MFHKLASWKIYLHRSVNYNVMLMITANTVAWSCIICCSFGFPNRNQKLWIHVQSSKVKSHSQDSLMLLNQRLMPHLHHMFIVFVGNIILQVILNNSSVLRPSWKSWVFHETLTCNSNTPLHLTSFTNWQFVVYPIS